MRTEGQILVRANMGIISESSKLLRNLPVPEVAKCQTPCDTLFFCHTVPGTVLSDPGASFHDYRQILMK